MTNEKVKRLLDDIIAKLEPESVNEVELRMTLLCLSYEILQRVKERRGELND